MSMFVIQASNTYTQEPVQAIFAATATFRCSCRTFEAQKRKATKTSKRVYLAFSRYKTWLKKPGTVIHTVSAGRKLEESAIQENGLGHLRYGVIMPEDCHAYILS